ncbi:MAG: glucokinase, partial [Methylobacteriaceae bacterium]|nr:glucokinase [Methylobacteriaceae bacterium]
VSRAALGVAGVVESNHASITNSPWVIDAAELQRQRGIERVRIVNDFEAIAWSVPRLTLADLYEIGAGKRVVAAPAVVLGPGTGLGLACFVPRPAAVVIAGEGGHVTLPATSPREDAVIAHLRARFDHVSAERAISGPGLVNLYEAIGARRNAAVQPRSGVEITNAALDGSCTVCREALDMFCAMLGTIAGNAALTFGARGGVYIAGGIAPRITEFLARSPFRESFESKGRFRPYLAAIATSVIIHPEPAFVGLSALAAQRLD